MAGRTPEAVRRTNAARAAAIKRLITTHSDEWKKVYAEEAIARGVAPRNADTNSKIQYLEAKLNELRAVYHEES